MTKIDHIPYRDHNFWMKIDCCGIWFLTPMDFHVFYTFCTVFLYWSLQSLLWGPKMSEKRFFSTISQMAGIGRKNVFWVVGKVLQMCSPHFQTQNDDISWLQEKNIINAKYPNIGYEVRIPFQCASKKIRVIRRVDQNISPNKSTPPPNEPVTSHLLTLFRAAWIKKTVF